MTSRLSKALVAGLCLSLLKSQALIAACQFFRFPQQVSEQVAKRSCLAAGMNNDLDQDGIPDWRAPLPGSHFYFPADEDLDGDRIHNLLDPDPFTANQINSHPCQNCLPQHALRYNDRKTQDLQRTLLAETGIYSMAYGHHSLTPSILEALLRMSRGSADLMHAAAPRLRFLLASETPLARDAQALYLEPIDAILISPHLATQSPAEQIRTLAHELGHALIFARFTPASFAAFAHQLADWPQTYPDNFYAPTLLTRYSGTVTLPEIFPNAYSFANPHEWFAENIAELVMKSLDLPHRANQDFANALYRQLNQRLVSH